MAFRYSPIIYSGTSFITICMIAIILVRRKVQKRTIKAMLPTFVFLLYVVINSVLNDWDFTKYLGYTLVAILWAFALDRPLGRSFSLAVRYNLRLIIYIILTLFFLYLFCVLLRIDLFFFPTNVGLAFAPLLHLHDFAAFFLVLVYNSGAFFLIFTYCIKSRYFLVAHFLTVWMNASKAMKFLSFIVFIVFSFSLFSTRSTFLNGRELLWIAGLSQVTLFGVGPGSLDLSACDRSEWGALCDAYSTHSVYLDIAIEQGLAGFLIFAIAMVSLIWHVPKQLKFLVMLLAGFSLVSGTSLLGAKPAVILLILRVAGRV